MKRKEQKPTGYVKKNKIWINNKIKQIEETSNKNETRKFFKEAQYFNKQQLVLPIFCKDKSGVVTTGVCLNRSHYL